jgi:hypothetical protein
MTTQNSASAAAKTASISKNTKNLTTAEAAKLLNVSIAWLERQRWLGTGPRYSKIGRSVRYPETLLLEYIAANLVDTTSV